MADVVLKNVTMIFKDTPAVKDVSLEAKDGEFLVLLGPSGCGKTTTLRMIAGLEKPTSGEIYIGDQLVNDIPPKDRDIAMVFQNYALYPHMTVYDNLAFPLKMRKFPKSEIESKVKKAAEILEITDLLERRPKQLSGGQRQRVALGRSIVREPKVFLMDEPLSNLDAKLRVQTRIEIKALQRKIGTTTIYVTHDQAEAMTLADRVAVMKSGMIQQVAPPTMVYSHPSNKFVAGFMGSPTMNFFDGVIVENNSHLFVNAQDQFLIPIDPSISESLRAKGGVSGRNVTYGIRAEDVGVNTSQSDGFVNFTIYGSELMGAEQFVYAMTGKASIVARATMTFPATLQQGVWMNLSSPNAHVFDEKSGDCLV
jgi:multiple sugar transport system ATP-binding protein